MKLAQALLLRADLQRRAAQLQERVVNNVQVQEGQDVAEDPRALMGEFEDVAAQLQSLIPRIHAINLVTRLPTGITLTEALSQRDILDLRLGMLRSAAQAASLRQARYASTELRTLAVIPARELQAQVDTLARQRRELDAQLQEANWLTEVPPL